MHLDMALFTTDENGDIDPGNVSDSIKETFVGEEVRQVKLPDDLLTQARQQGVTREVLRVSSRRYIAMRMSDLESLAPTQSFERLPLGLQAWLEVNIIQRMPRSHHPPSFWHDRIQLPIIPSAQHNERDMTSDHPYLDVPILTQQNQADAPLLGQDQTDFPPSPIQQYNRQYLPWQRPPPSLPIQRQREARFEHRTLENMKYDIMAQEISFFAGPTQYSLENFTVYSPEAMSLSQKIEQRAAEPTAQLVLSFWPNSADEDWLGAMTTLREEFWKEESVAHFCGKSNSLMTNEDFNEEIENFNWNLFDTELPVHQSINKITQDSLPGLESYVDARCNANLAEFPDGDVEHAPVRSDSCINGTHYREVRDAPVLEAPAMENIQCEDWPDAMIAEPKELRSDEELQLTKMQPKSRGNGDIQTYCARKTKTTQDTFSAIKTRQRMDYPTLGSAWSWGTPSTTFVNPSSFAPPVPIPPRNLMATIMEDAPQYSRQPSSSTPNNSFPPRTKPSQTPCLPPPHPDLPTKPPTSSLYDMTSDPGFAIHNSEMSSQISPSFKRSKMSDAQHPYSMYAYTRNLGGNRMSNRDRFQNPERGSGKGSAHREGDIRSRGMHNHQGSISSFTSDAKQHQDQGTFRYHNHPQQTWQPSPSEYRKLRKIQGGQHTQSVTPKQRVNDTPIPLDLFLLAKPQSHHQKGVFRFHTPRECSNFTKGLQAASSSFDGGHLLTIEGGYDPESTTVTFVAGEGQKIVTLLKKVLGDDYSKYSEGLKVV